MYHVGSFGNRLSSIKVFLSGHPVNLTAKGSGYLEIFKDMKNNYYVNAVPQTGESFINWTNAAGTEFSAAAKFNLTDGTTYDLTANFTALELTSDVSSGKIYTGGRITLTPNREGGTWTFDSAFLSRDGNTFTALKAGKTTITYTVGGTSTSYDVTILAADLPQAGQNFTWAWLLGAAAVLILGAAGFVVARWQTAAVRQR